MSFSHAPDRLGIIDDWKYCDKFSWLLQGLNSNWKNKVFIFIVRKQLEIFDELMYIFLFFSLMN